MLDSELPRDSRAPSVTRRVSLFGAGAALSYGEADSRPVLVSDLCCSVR
jgi:hypothetical protein